MKGEMRPNSMTQALDELIAEGVILLVLQETETKSKLVGIIQILIITGTLVLHLLLETIHSMSLVSKYIHTQTEEDSHSKVE